MTINNNQYNQIQLLYKLIKKDDLLSFQQILKKNPEFIHYSNKYGKTMFNYSLDKGASKIAKYLLINEPSLLFKKYKSGDDIFLDLINKNSEIGLNTFFNLLDSEQLEKMYSLNRKKPLYLNAIKNLDEKNWNLFYSLSSRFINVDSLSFSSVNGFNVAHIIALSNHDYCLPILKNAPSSIYHQIDNDSGSTPLLVSARYSNPVIINYLLKHSNIYSTTFLGSNLAYVGTLNNDIKSFQTIINQNIGLIDKNSYDYTPLMSSILEKSDLKASLLLPYYTNLDISEELLEASSSFSNFETFFNNTLLSISDINFESLRSSPKKIETLFSNIFYYCDEKMLITLRESKLWNLLDNIKDNKFYVHQIYTSSIMNRKAMSKKINFLLFEFDFLHANDTESFYSPIINGNELTFKNIYIDDESKSQKSFCFIAALGVLPIGQIKDILEHTNVIKNLNEFDLLLLFSIGLKKKSSYIIEVAIKEFNKKNPSFIEDDTNYNEAIQNNLSKYKINNSYDKYYKKILTYFKHIPSNLLSNIAYYLVSENQPISSFENTLNLFKEYPHHKKEIVSSVVLNLLQVDNPHPDFLNLFFQKPTLLFYVFKSAVLNNPSILKNNELFSYIVEHSEFNYSAKNWKFIFSLANSDNIEKHHLIKKILPKCKMKNQTDFLVFQQSLLSNRIDDHTWRMILNSTFKEPVFQAILNQYLLYTSLQENDGNLVTLKKVVSKIDDSFTNTKLWLSNIIKKKNHNDSTVLFFEDLFLRKNNTQDLMNLALEYSNFSYLEHLISEHEVNIQNVPLENFWNSDDMKEIFKFTFINNQYQPLQNYLFFINHHLNEINNLTLNNIVLEFSNWFLSSSIENQTKITVAQYLFSTLNKKISLIDNDSLAGLCSIFLKNNNDDININSLSKFIQSKNLNDVFEKIFTYKDQSFFHTLQENKKFMENKEELSDNNKKIMNYYYLNEDIKEKKTTVKKVNKI